MTMEGLARQICGNDESKTLWRSVLGGSGFDLAFDGARPSILDSKGGPPEELWHLQAIHLQIFPVLFQGLEVGAG